MLHCTFIKGKIIAVDNWGGRDRMEEFSLVLIPWNWRLQNVFPLLSPV